MSATDLLGRWSQAERVLALYGLAPVEDPAAYWGVQVDDLVAFDTLRGHDECWISRFCRNPLHPGPCKGWKKKLGQVAPGVLAMIEADRKKKLAEKKAKIEAAKKAASKAVNAAERGVEVDAHPAAKKKMGAKLAAKVLAEDPDKAEAKAAKLTQKEMAWHAQKKASQLLAANMAAGNLKTKAAQAKYKAYARKEILAALKKDNETGATGPDSEYQKTLHGLAQAMASSHAAKHFKNGDENNENGDEVQAALADAFEGAIKKDLADQKQQGDDPGNVKALTKKLDDLPGEPGSDEHEKAVADAMGVTLKKQQPFNASPEPDAPAPGGMTPAQAKKFATAWGKVAQVIGIPKAKWPGLKAKAEAIALKGGDPLQDPVIQKAIQDAVGALVAKAWNHGFVNWDPKAKDVLAEAYAKEIADLVTKGGTKLEEGSLLDLANKLKTGKIGNYFHEKKIEEKFPDLPKKTGFKKMEGTGVPASKTDQALDDAFSPPAPQSMDDVDPPKQPEIKITTGVKDVTPGVAKNDGGAGAGGPTSAKKSGTAYADLHEEIYADGEGDNVGDQVADELAAAKDDADTDGQHSINAGTLAAALILDIDDGMTDDEKKALHAYVKPMIVDALKTGDSAQAKKAIQTLKKMDGAQVKNMAKAMKQNIDEGASPSTDGGASTPSPVVAVTSQQKAQKMMSGFADAATQLDPDSASKVNEVMTKPENIKQIADGIDSGKVDPVGKIKNTAISMAPKIINKKDITLGTSLSLHEKNALSDDLAEAVALQVATGQPHPLVTAVAEADADELKKLAKASAKKNNKGVMGQLSDAVMAGDLSTLDDKIGKALETPDAGVSPKAVKVSDELFKSAGLEPKVYSGLASQLQLAIANGDAESAAEALEDLSKALAKGFTKKHLDGFGFYDADSQKLAGEIITKITKDYLDAIEAGADEPGGLVAALPNIAKQAKDQADQIAKDNGWPLDGKALAALKGSKLLVDTGALAGNLDAQHTAAPKLKGVPAVAPPAPAAPSAPSAAPAKAAAKATKTAAKKASPAKKAAPKKTAASTPTKAAVMAGKGKKPTAADHGVLVNVQGQPNPNGAGAPVSKPIKQNGQTILPPEGIYPISQVIVDGRETEVAEFNAKVNAGLQGKDAAKEPRNFSELKGNQKNAVYHYSSYGYSSINKHLRPPNPGGPADNPGSAGSSASAATNVAHMDAAFNDSRITQPITTLRGFTGSERALGDLWNRRDESWAGAEIRDLGYSSSSINMGTARGFAGAPGADAVVMRIHMPAGTRAINLVGQGAHGGEAEILLNRGARLRIVADNGYQNGARHLDVEVICESDDCAE